MIIRIVKMTFQPDKVSEFLEIFERSKTKIRAFEGCESLTLLRQEDDSCVYFTHSTWKSSEHLDNYRHSELFKKTWTLTKALFAAKPEAWSLTIQQ
jgi:quinol monooxygenase YgiN